MHDASKDDWAWYDAEASEETSLALSSPGISFFRQLQLQEPKKKKKKKKSKALRTERLSRCNVADGPTLLRRTLRMSMVLATGTKRRDADHGAFGIEKRQSFSSLLPGILGIR